MRIEDGVRFDLEMSVATEDLLKRLSSKDESTFSQVMTKALALYDVATRAVDAGQRIIVVDDEFKPVCEIVGLLKKPEVEILHTQLRL